MDDTLEDEVKAVRVAIRRVMVRLKEQISPAEYARLTSLVFSGASTVSRLLQARKSLGKGETDVIGTATPIALDEISQEKNIDL